MANILKILQIDNTKELNILRMTSKEVNEKDIKDSSFQQFLDDLIYTAEEIQTVEGYRAAGLAAIQVGNPVRVFCILKDNNEFQIMINPQIKKITEDTSIESEACLSIPKKEGYVQRYKKIKVTYLNREGERKRERFTNWEAREIQHEYDHLEGILFTDKIID